MHLGGLRPTLEPISASPSEAVRLVGAAGRRLVASGIPWGAEQAQGLAEGVRTGRLDGRVWIGPKDEGAALAVWEPGVPAGRRAFVYLDDGFRTPRLLGGFVDRLRGEPGATPLVSVLDPVPAMPDAEVDAVLAARGFERLLRIDLSYPAVAPLPSAPEVAGVRNLRRDDAEGVARILREGYEDNPGDRALFRFELDALDDSRHAVRQLFEGGVGQFWPEASFAVPDPAAPDRLLAVTVVCDLKGPLLAEVIVAPDGRRRGFARRLVQESLRAVRARTAEPLRLVVTLRNRRAYRLYDSLGFVRLEATLGGPWVHPGELGVSSLDPPFDL
jgi:GNAT superfamily N-acetyltransferase